MFLDWFGRLGNDKGKVEGLVGYARRNFLVPIPTFASFAELNAHLKQRCLERLDHRVRGHAEGIGERLVCAVEQGSSARGAAAWFAVSVSVAIKLMWRVRATGSTASAKIGGYRLTGHRGLFARFYQPNLSAKIP